MATQLTASLHTVTAVSRVAEMIAKTGNYSGKYLPSEKVTYFTALAFEVLGYTADRISLADPKQVKLVAACHAAVAKAIG